MANNLASPTKIYPGLAATVKAYLKCFVGFCTTFNKEALFPQDVEHLIDVCGIDTPQKLQRTGMYCTSITFVCSLKKENPAL